MNCDTYLALEFAHKPAWPTGFEKSKIHQPYLEKLQFSVSKIEVFLVIFFWIFPQNQAKMLQSCFLWIAISQDWVDVFQISQSLWVRQACGHILKLSRFHNSCKQNFCVTKCPKTVLFVQFHNTGTVSQGSIVKCYVETGNGKCEFDSAATTVLNCNDFYNGCKTSLIKGIHNKMKICENFIKFVFPNQAGNGTRMNLLDSCSNLNKDEDDECRLYYGKWARCYCSNDLCNNDVGHKSNSNVESPLLISLLWVYVIISNV